MTDLQTPTSPWPRRWLRVLLVILVGAGGFALVRWTAQTLEIQAQQDQVIRQLARDVQRLEAENADTARMAVADKAGLADLNTRFDALDAQTARLTDTVQGGRLRVQAASAELLLTAAAQHLLLEHDPQLAARLLDLADRRLAGAADARLSPVRKALAEERVALLAVPVADRIGTALLLAALIRQAPQWPLAFHGLGAAVQFEPPAPALENATPPQGWLQRGWFSAQRALGAMFSLRRDNRNLRRALLPEQEALIRQILLLKLEGARLAFLRGEATSFRDLCESAAQVLAQEYRVADSGVISARAELQRLARLELRPALPETGRALSLLRALLDAQP